MGSCVRYASDATPNVAPGTRRYELAPNRVPTKGANCGRFARSRGTLTTGTRSPRDRMREGPGGLGLRERAGRLAPARRRCRPASGAGRRGRGLIGQQSLSFSWDATLEHASGATCGEAGGARTSSRRGSRADWQRRGAGSHVLPARNPPRLRRGGLSLCRWRNVSRAGRRADSWPRPKGPLATPLSFRRFTEGRVVGSARAFGSPPRPFLDGPSAEAHTGPW